MECYDVECVSSSCMEQSEEIRYSERRQTVVFEVINKVNWRDLLCWRWAEFKSAF